MPGPAPDLSRPWALVPLRGLEDAKTRLGAELDPEERVVLVTAMAERTLAATRDAASLSGTVLVTADPEAAVLAEGFGARTLVQRLPGLNAALREARTLAVEAGATAILVVPIDLAAISAAAIDEVVAAARAAADAGAADRRRPIVAIVPDRQRGGTNALLVSPPAAIDPAFGDASFARHLARAEAAGAEPLVLGGPLTLDVDTASDLLAVEAATAAGGRGGRDAA